MPRLIIEEPGQLAQQMNASPNSFGALQGQAMQQTGRVMQRLGEVLDQNLESDARTRAIQYESALKQEAMKIELEPDLQRRLELYDEAETRLRGQYRPKRGKGAVYDMFAEMSAGEQRSLFEFKVATDGIKQTRDNDAIALNSLANKAAVAESPEEIEAFILEGRELLEERQAAGIYSPAEREEREVTTLYGMVNQMATKNPSLAAEYHNRYRERLTPEMNVALDKKVQTEDEIEQSQIIADSVLDDLGPNATLEQYRKAVRDRSSGPVRERAEAQVGEAYQAHQISQNKAESDSLDRYAQIIAGTFDPANEDRPAPQDLERNWHTIRRQAEASGLNASQVSQLRTLYSSYATGKDVKTDEFFYDDVMNNPSKIGTPGYTEDVLRLRLAPEQVRQVLGARRKLESGDFADQEMITREINAELDRQEITEKSDRGHYRLMIQARLETTGQPVTPDIVRAESKAAIATGTDAGFAFRDSPTAGLEQSIDDYREQDPKLYRRALYRASEGGQFEPTEIQIEAQINALRKFERDIRRKYSKERADEIIEEERKKGDAGARALIDRGYPDAEDALSITDEDRRRWGMIE